MARINETHEIVFNEKHPYQGTPGYEPSESDPIIDTLLEPETIINRGSGYSGYYNPGQSYVNIPVDYRVRRSYQTSTIQWFKNGQLYKSCKTANWIGRTSLRIKKYHPDVEGLYKLVITDAKGRTAVTQGRVVLR